MEITNPEAITGIKICQYCKIHCFNFRNSKHYARFNKHVEECKERGGKFIRDVELSRTQKPYAPHIQKQPIYAYLLAHGFEEYFQPTRYYITYDFETLEDVQTKQISAHTTIQAHLTPFMVSCTVKKASGVETRNFCLATDEHFIEALIEYLFEQAKIVAEDNKAQYYEAMGEMTEEQFDAFDTLLNRE